MTGQIQGPDGRSHRITNLTLHQDPRGIYMPGITRFKERALDQAQPGQTLRFDCEPGFTLIPDADYQVRRDENPSRTYWVLVRHVEGRQHAAEILCVESSERNRAAA